MTKDKLIKLLILIAVAVIIWFIPAPEGLSPVAWHAFAIYAAAILGLIIKPFPEPIVLMSAVAAMAIFLDDAKGALSGYASTTVWLVFSAFALSVAFVSTGLGRRIAYVLIGKLGGTSLGLGYVTAFLDLIIAPVTPSNTARAGGIVTPIMQSVAVALGSEPGESSKKIGSYLMVNVYMVTKITSFMFLTAMAANALAGNYMRDIAGVNIDWMTWFKGLFVPGFILLMLVPFVDYIMTRPELKKIDNKKIAAEGLKELGPMSIREKFLVALFILALLGWMLPSVLSMTGVANIKINATAVALCVMAGTFLTGVIEWPDLVKNKGAWSTLLWFGGIIGLSSVLTKAGFFLWLAEVLKGMMNFGDHSLIALWVIIALSVAVRYLFASGSAYVAAMLPVFLVVGHAAGAQPMALALALCASNSYGGCLTHYGGAAAPIIYGAGYNTTKQWWTIGAVIGVLCYLFMMTVGYAWWNMIGLLG